MNGYACKKCGGPAPTGVGYVIEGQAPEPARGACDCGYSIAPTTDPVTRIIETVKATIPDAQVIDVEVVDWDEWDAGGISAGLMLNDVVRAGGGCGFRSWPDRMNDLRDAVAGDLAVLPVEWWAANVSEHGYATITIPQ